MKRNDLFPSNFLRAVDLQGKAVALVMEQVTMQDIGDYFGLHYSRISRIVQKAEQEKRRT